jgi:hypothetical protein
MYVCVSSWLALSTIDCACPFTLAIISSHFCHKSATQCGKHEERIGNTDLRSSGQSSWLQIRRPGFDLRHYPKKKVMGLERGPLGLVSTTEELLNRKVAAPA